MRERGTPALRVPDPYGVNRWILSAKTSNIRVVRRLPIFLVIRWLSRPFWFSMCVSVLPDFARAFLKVLGTNFSPLRALKSILSSGPTRDHPIVQSTSTLRAGGRLSLGSRLKIVARKVVKFSASNALKRDLSTDEEVASSFGPRLVPHRSPSSYPKDHHLPYDTNIGGEHTVQYEGGQ